MEIFGKIQVGDTHKWAYCMFLQSTGLTTIFNQKQKAHITLLIKLKYSTLSKCNKWKGKDGSEAQVLNSIMEIFKCWLWFPPLNRRINHFSSPMQSGISLKFCIHSLFYFARESISLMYSYNVHNLLQFTCQMEYDMKHKLQQKIQNAFIKSEQCKCILQQPILWVIYQKVKVSEPSL